MDGDNMITDSGNIVQEDVVEPTVRFNNEVIPVSQLENKAREMEASLQRGFQDKIAKERQAMHTALDEDTLWYAQHDQSLWRYYEPKVNGGKGFTGDPKMLDTQTKTQNQEQPQVNVNLDNTEIVNLKREIESLKSSMAGQEISKVAEIRDSIIGRYAYADLKAVNARMQEYYIANGRHPSKHDIETIISESDMHVRKFIQAINKPTNNQAAKPAATGIPPIGGKAPDAKSNEKLPRLDSPDFLTKVVYPKLQG